MKNQIEKIANFLLEASRQDSNAIFDSDTIMKYGCDRLNGATALYKAGYRQQSDTAQEIFGEITNLLLSVVYLGADGKWHTRKKYASELHSFVENFLELKEKYTGGKA